MTWHAPLRWLLHLFFMIATPPAFAQKRLALLIGNNDYRPKIGKLTNPANDIQIVGDALEKIGFKSPKSLANQTRLQMLEAVNAYAGEPENATWDTTTRRGKTSPRIASRLRRRASYSMILMRATCKNLAGSSADGLLAAKPPLFGV